jgi:hypothetical protein
LSDWLKSVDGIELFNPDALGFEGSESSMIARKTDLVLRCTVHYLNLKKSRLGKFAVLWIGGESTGRIDVTLESPNHHSKRSSFKKIASRSHYELFPALHTYSAMIQRLPL